MNLMKSPRKVDISITHRCNLRCLYCSHFTSPGEVAKDLPSEEWMRFFKELRDLSVLEVCLQGGEPLLRDDLSELIDSIIENKMRYSILTNGTLIDEPMAARIASTGGRCSYVQVSLDGSEPATHDSCRGEGNFERAIRGIRLLKKYGIETTVRVTIHRWNVADLDNIARLLLDELDLMSFSTNSASFLGLCRGNSKAVQLTTEDRMAAMEALLKIEQKYPGRISAASGPLAEARTWREMEKARNAGIAQIPGRGYLTACGGTMNRIAVRADGIIVPCIQLSHIQLGRINEDSLDHIWTAHPELNRIRARKAIPLSSFEFCRDCAYINYCTGNCPAIAYNLSGIDTRPSPNACLQEFLKEGGSLPSL